jgi:hypothetical protein
MFSRGSENFRKEKYKNVRSSYSASSALVRSFQAESAKIPSTLRRRYRLQFAFSIPWCNGRVCSWGDLFLTRTSPHVIGIFFCRSAVAFGIPRLIAF